MHSGLGSTDEIILRGLPPHLARLPMERDAWAAWRDDVMLWRAGMLVQAERDRALRQELLALAREDVLTGLCLFGCVFEPRDRLDVRGHIVAKGWLPLIPFPFQAVLVRWLARVCAVLPGSPEAQKGRGDGVVEKARGMAFSWTVCAYLAQRWLFDHDFLAGVMSYKEDLVDRTGATDTLFFKVRANIGVESRVPAFRPLMVHGERLSVPIRPPSWLIPKGWDHHVHDTHLVLTHPERTNVIQGYTTTRRTGTGARLTMMVIDEAAKFVSLRDAWEAASAVTDHRVAGSSADMSYGTGFRDLARWAEEANQRDLPGPSFLRLTPDAHPERDARWRTETMARHAGDELARRAFAREYELDYEAGHGEFIYPMAREITPKPLEFDPLIHRLDVAIDPGIRERTAIHLIMFDPGTTRYGVLASYVQANQPAEFYATLFLAEPLGHYRYGDEEQRIMSWFERYGHLVRLWVGDPAGKQRGGAGMSFYEAISRAVNELSDGGRRIVITAGGSQDYRRFASRHDALRWLLQRCDFNDTPDVIATLRAIRDYRYKVVADREVTHEPTTPVRSYGHDRVTALEYYAVNRRLSRMATPSSPMRTVVLTPSGRPRLASARGGVRAW